MDSFGFYQLLDSEDAMTANGKTLGHFQIRLSAV